MGKDNLFDTDHKSGRRIWEIEGGWCNFSWQTPVWVLVDVGICDGCQHEILPGSRILVDDHLSLFCGDDCANRQAFGTFEEYTLRVNIPRHHGSKTCYQ